MAGTPFNLVQRQISPGLVKDLWINPLRPKTSEMAKGHERKVELPGIEPRAIGLMRQCSATKLQLPSMSHVTCHTDKHRNCKLIIHNTQCHVY